MADFDAFNPPKKLTDPKNLGANPRFPAHVYRFAEVPTRTSLIVAWIDDQPVHNEALIVADEKALAKALKQGFKEAPVLPSEVAA